VQKEIMTMRNSSTRHILMSDIPATPWKNGGGVTREIATGAAPRPGAGWGWRVSLADVAQDGPFSIFPGVDRVLAVIEGAGMDLVRPDGRVVALDPFQPVRFAGEEPLSGRLRRGPVRDLNAMVRRDRFTAEMEIRQGPSAVTDDVSARDCLVVLNLTGSCTVRFDDNETRDLVPAGILIHDGARRVDIRLTENSRAAVIRIGHRAEGC
jgi:environmental stress-induced protein Ves